jgi:hypothetical protein
MLILQELIIFQIGVKVGYGAKEFDLNGDKMLNYIKLSYRDSIADGKTINVSGMEFIHMDVWTLMCKN